MQRIVMPLERFGSAPSDEAEARSPSTSTRHAATETKPEAELRAEPELGRVTSLIEAEVTLAASVATPAALGGASLLAYGAAIPNQTCTALGLVAIVAVGASLHRTRSRVRRIIVEEARRQGLSQEQGRAWATRTLKSWSF